jgi:hypothetical protein
MNINIGRDDFFDYGDEDDLREDDIEDMELDVQERMIVE